MNTVAKVLLFDKHSNALVLRRSATHPHYGLEADLPGGTIDGDETPEVAAKREVLEEVGIDIFDQKIELAHERITAGGRRDIVFVAHINAETPEVALSWEHDQFTWVPQEKLLGSLETTDDYMIVVREYLQDLESNFLG